MDENHPPDTGRLLRHCQSPTSSNLFPACKDQAAGPVNLTPWLTKVYAPLTDSLHPDGRARCLFNEQREHVVIALTVAARLFW
jgi:hypothetical protein